MTVARVSPDTFEAWLALRTELYGEWPGHRDEALAFLARDDMAIFVTRSEAGVVTGFAEAALRRDYVNGCETSPVAFLEGIYVRPHDRRQGLARALVSAVSAWAVAKGCSELASDAALDNLDSHRMHEALGLAETERVVYFRKALKTG